MTIRPARSVWLLVVVGLAFLAVSRTTGAGWLVVLVAVVAGVLLVGMIGPLAAIRSPSIEVVTPPDAVSGAPVTLTVEIGKGAVVLTFVDFDVVCGLTGPSRGTLEIVPSHRGVWDRLRIDVRSGAPFGLVWITRRLVVDLPRSLVVSPAPQMSPAVAPTNRAAGAEGAIVAGRGGDGTVASLAEYRHGDPMRRIHWSATARHGDLLVKQLEPPVAQRLTVVAQLSGDRDVQEEIAGRALGLVLRSRTAGVPVELWTRTAAGIVKESVDSTLSAGRSLAFAIPGRIVATAPDPTSRVIVVSA